MSSGGWKILPRTSPKWLVSQYHGSQIGSGLRNRSIVPKATAIRRPFAGLLRVYVVHYNAYRLPARGIRRPPTCSGRTRERHAAHLGMIRRHDLLTGLINELRPGGRKAKVGAPSSL
jgi:hypothetical protein